MSSLLKSMNIQKFRTDLEERQWKGDFTFVQGADCQFGLIARLKAEKAPKWDEELKLSEAAVQYINRLRPKPKFFVICGDMLDAFPFKGVFTQFTASIGLHRLRFWA